MTDVLSEIYAKFEDAVVVAAENAEKTRGVGGIAASDTEAIKKQMKVVKAGMSDAERYSILKNTQIVAISDEKSAKQPIYTEIEKIPEKAKGQVEKLIRDLADDLEILNVPLSTSALDIEFQLSKNNGLSESLSQQLKYGGNFHYFAKALINLRDILKRSVLVEAHTEDRYKGTGREDINFEAGYVLFSAFKSQEYIIPVKLEIKQKKDVHNILYVVVSMTKIERTSVMESTLDNTEVFDIPLSDTDSVYSLSHLMSKVNPKDRHFLKYLPDQMLSPEQIAAKKLALKEDKDKLDEIIKKAEEQPKSQKKSASSRSILASALESTIDTSTEEGKSELEKLKEYQSKIALIEQTEARLAEVKAEIHDISFTKASDRSKLPKLNEEKIKLQNRLVTYDRQLARLEAMKPLQDLLKRERESSLKSEITSRAFKSKRGGEKVQ